MSLKKIRNISIVFALVFLSGAIGYDLGRKAIAVNWSENKPYVTIENKYPPDGKDIDFGLFWQIWDRLGRDYIDKDKLVPQNMVWGAIKGLVSSVGDPYTVFLPPEENKRAKEDLAGSFEGIGAQLGMKNKRIIVVAPLRGMPAEKAGLKPGDYIVEVDGKDTNGWTLPEAVNNIRGKKGTQVVLTIVREGEAGRKEVPITRGTINVPSIETQLARAKCVDSKTNIKENSENKKNAECKIIKAEKCADCPRIAVLSLYQFGDRTNGEWEDAVNAIREYADSGTTVGGEFAGMILDLRNNPGGYLQSAVYVASEFIKEGTIVKQQDKKGGVQEYKVSREGKLTDIPMVVLVNEGSASASEIVAGALKEHNRATIVGKTTFGKGSVQEAQELPGGAGLHITTAKWLLPSGHSISGNGIKPDIIVDNNLDEPEKDRQFEKGIEVLLGK